MSSLIKPGAELPMYTPDTAARAAEPHDRLKILLVDDHPIWCEGAASVLQGLPLGRPTLVLQAASGAEALNQARMHPDLSLLLLDLSMPGMDGMSTLQALRRQTPGLRVLMMSASESTEDVRRCLAAGALGYLPKGADVAQLTAALNLVLAGCVYVPPLMLAAAAPTADRPNSASGQAPTADADMLLQLTPRQMDVLKLLRDGQSNRQISAALGLAEKTTKAHVGAIFRALGVINRTQAALLASRLLVPANAATIR